MTSRNFTENVQNYYHTNLVEVQCTLGRTQSNIDRTIGNRHNGIYAGIAKINWQSLFPTDCFPPLILVPQCIVYYSPATISIDQSKFSFPLNYSEEDLPRNITAIIYAYITATTFLSLDKSLQKTYLTSIHQYLKPELASLNFDDLLVWIESKENSLLVPLIANAQPNFAHPIFGKEPKPFTISSTTIRSLKLKRNTNVVMIGVPGTPTSSSHTIIYEETQEISGKLK